MINEGASPDGAGAAKNRQSKAGLPAEASPTEQVYDLTRHTVKREQTTDRTENEQADPTKAVVPSPDTKPDSQGEKTEADQTEGATGEMAGVPPVSPAIAGAIKPTTTGIASAERRKWMLPPTVTEYKEAFDALDRGESPNQRMVDALMEHNYLAVIPEEKRTEKLKSLDRQKARFSDLESLQDVQRDYNSDRRILSDDIHSLNSSLRHKNRVAVERFARLRERLESERGKAILHSTPVKIWRAILKNSIVRKFRAKDQRPDLQSQIELKERHRDSVTKRYEEISKTVELRQKEKRTYEKGMAELDSHVATDHGHVVLNILGNEARRVVNQRFYQLNSTQRQLEQTERREKLYDDKVREIAQPQKERSWWSGETSNQPAEDTHLWKSELYQHQREARREARELRDTLKELNKIEEGFLPEPAKEASPEEIAAQTAPVKFVTGRTATQRYHRPVTPIIQPVEKLQTAPLTQSIQPPVELPAGHLPFFAPPAGQQAYTLIRDGHLESGNKLLLASADNLKPGSYLQLVEKVSSSHCESGRPEKAIEVLKQHEANLKTTGTRRVAAILIVKATEENRADQIPQLAESFSPSDRDVARAIHDLAMAKVRNDGPKAGLEFATRSAEAACSHLTTRITDAVKNSITKTKRKARQQSTPGEPNT